MWSNMRPSNDAVAKTPGSPAADGCGVQGHSGSVSLKSKVQETVVGNCNVAQEHVVEERGGGKLHLIPITIASKRL